MKNTKLNFVELIELMNDGKLKEGQIIESDIFDSDMMVGAGGKGLVWSYNPEKPVALSPHVLASKYTLPNPYKEITILEMFKTLLQGDKSVYYNVCAEEDRERVNAYYPIEEILELGKTNVFTQTTLNEEVRFYKKMF